MRLKDLKNQYPKTPDFISEMIETEVEKQIHTQETVRRSRKKKQVWTLGRTATAAAVACVLIGTGAYAAVNVYRNYHMKMEQQGNYSVVTGLTEETEEQTTKTQTLPDQIAEVKGETSYIPEGMEWKDERHLDYTNSENKGGFSFESVLIGDGNLEEGLTDTSVEESEQTTFGEHEGVYLKYHSVRTDTHFNQRIYLLCPEESRVLIVYIGSDVSKEEAYKVAEGITLTETGEMISTADMWDWDAFIQNSKGEVVEEDESGFMPYDSVVPADQLHIYSMGEEIYKEQAFTEEEKNVSLRVDSLQVSDDFSLLNESYIPDEWKDRLDENGKLKENDASYVKRGDGVNTLDEVVRTESFPAKLVYATLTVTNHSDQEIQDILYYIKMSLLTQTDDGYQEYNYMEQSGEDYDYVEWNSGLSLDGGMGYYDNQNGIGKNYISGLAAGESTKVNVAWIVNEGDLNNMYLEVSGFCASLTGPNADVAQLVDVRR